MSLSCGFCKYNCGGQSQVYWKNARAGNLQQCHNQDFLFFFNVPVLFESIGMSRSSVVTLLWIACIIS